MTSPAVDGRLGRVFVGHDERSRAYGVAEHLPATVERKPTFWGFPAHTSAPLDQGHEGACTAYSFAHEEGAGPVQVPRTAAWARRFFTAIQATDRAAGNDLGDGATMLSAAKTARARGYITGYRWAFGAGQVVDALCSVGPVWLGMRWLGSMMRADTDGLIPVAGQVAGGHAICAVGYDEHPNHGPVVALLNSWGPSWGVAEPRLGVRGGVGWLRVDDLAQLLAQDGEAIVASDFLPGRRT